MSQESKRILGIETSCDETAVSIIKGDDKRIKVLSNAVSSQINIHKKYSGVIPEVAAREHVVNVIPVLDEAIKESGVSRDNISQYIQALAVTVGPGLVTSLMTGIETAKALSFAWDIPIIGINHIEGHIYANFIGDYIESNIEFPVVVLTVSGGHTMLVFMKDHGDYEVLGTTRDDAAGEAFDKAAQLMELGYPGGPVISEKAQEYIINHREGMWSSLALPRPMNNTPDYDFSFSGLKTSLLYQLRKDSEWRNKISYYCYEFQQAIIDVLITKTLKAVKDKNAKTLMLAGGVTANQKLRQDISDKIKKECKDINLFIPLFEFTTDNAAMIATAGYFKAKQKQFNNLKDLTFLANKKL